MKCRRERRRYNIVDCGRQWGKTADGTTLICERAIQGESWGWFAPGYKYTIEPWNRMESTLKQVASRSSRTDRRIELITGGVIDVWSLENPDAGRGRTYDGIIIDEAAMVRKLKEIYELSLRATLLVKRGEMWMYSTPKGKDYFWECWQRGQSDEFPDWMSWQMPTWTNPYVTAEEIEAMRREMPPRSFAQEVEAQFLDAAAGGLFDPEKWKYSDDTPKLAKWVRFWDLATEEDQEADYTVGALVGLGPDGTVWIRNIVRFREEWPIAREIIRKVTSEDVRYCLEIGALYVPAVEKAGQQGGLIKDLQWGEKTYFLPESVKGKKKERAAMWSWRQCQGMVCMMRSAWNAEFIGECHYFDGKGLEHDDQVDAVSGAFALLYRDIGAEVKQEEIPEPGTWAYIEMLRKQKQRGRR